MEPSSALLIGMGAAAAGFAGAGVGIGYIFGKMIEAVARQPEAEARVGKYVWIGFALVVQLFGNRAELEDGYRGTSGLGCPDWDSDHGDTGI